MGLSSIETHEVEHARPSGPWQSDTRTQDWSLRHIHAPAGWAGRANQAARAKPRRAGPDQAKLELGRARLGLALGRGREAAGAAEAAGTAGAAGAARAAESMSRAGRGPQGGRGGDMGRATRGQRVAGRGPRAVGASRPKLGRN